METDQNMAVYAALGIGGYLAALFMVFAHRIGALAAFGRRPLDNRRFLALSAGAFVPGACCLASIYMAGAQAMLDSPAMLAVSMATVAVAGRRSLIALGDAALPLERRGQAEEG